MSVELIGSREYSQTLLKMQKDLHLDADRLMEKAARGTANIAKAEIQGGSRSGRTYRRRSIKHKASAPGEFPKTDTGALVSSIHHWKRGPADYTAGSDKNAPHGFWLELKAPSRGGRPWLEPSVKKVILKFERLARSTIR